GPGPCGSLMTASANSAGRPMLTSSVDSSVHIVERTLRSLVHSIAIRRGNCVPTPVRGAGLAATGTVVVVMSGSLVRGAGAGSGGRIGVVLDAVARQLHERLRQRGALRRELVQHGAGVRGGLADGRCLGTGDVQCAVVADADARAVLLERRAQAGPV